MVKASDGIVPHCIEKGRFEWLYRLANLAHDKKSSFIFLLNLFPKGKRETGSFKLDLYKPTLNSLYRPGDRKIIPSDCLLDPAPNRFPCKF